MTQDKTRLIWEGPSRPYKAVDRKYYTGMLGVGIALFLFLAFAGQFTIIIVLLSILFTTYAFYAFPPTKVSYSLSDSGINIADEFVPWSDVTSFFTEKRLDTTLISLNVKTKALSRVKYIIPDTDTTLVEAMKIIEEHVPRFVQKEEKNIIAKLVERISFNIRE